jgi:phosphosulfolactate synthase
VLKTAFDLISVPPFPEKPREKGLTMIIDYGLGLASQQDLMESGGWFIDLGKIATGVSRVLPEAVLKKKIQAYGEGLIKPFPGGQFFELAYLQKKVVPFFDTVAQAGYTHVEISDNCIDLSPADKGQAIRQARQQGLTVLGEVGKKNVKSDSRELAADIQRTLEAGAWKVLVEAMELFDEKLDTALVESISRIVPLEKLIFETPSTWMKGVDFHAQYDLWKWLLAHLGPEVNIGNVPPEQAVRLACLRLGVGSDPTLEKGAFRLSRKGLLK